MTHKTWGASFAAASTDALGYYERIFVPSLFTPWAELLLDLIDVAEGASVVDIACGPGSVTRLAAARAGASGRVTGIDLSPAMLEIARSKGAPDGGAPITYVESPAAPLAIPGDSCDFAACQQGLQFFPDRPAAVREIHRVLRRGGRAGIATWTAIDESPPFHALSRAIARVAGEEVGAKYAGDPWSLHDPRELESLLEGAGFVDVSVTREQLPWTLEGGALQLSQTLFASGVATELAQLTESDDDALVDAVDELLRAETDEEGAIHSHAVSNLAVGRKP